jgi:hypothetical protein
LSHLHKRWSISWKRLFAILLLFFAIFLVFAIHLTKLCGVRANGTHLSAFPIAFFGTLRDFNEIAPITADASRCIMRDEIAQTAAT